MNHTKKYTVAQLYKRTKMNNEHKMNTLLEKWSSKIEEEVSTGSFNTCISIEDEHSRDDIYPFVINAINILRDTIYPGINVNIDSLRYEGWFEVSWDKEDVEAAAKEEKCKNEDKDKKEANK